ncbi:MAG TPA: flagellar biosynthetic protein FliR [Deltaproteobacteria bacterium]|nr:flagellar biosynthetic protein FliR [Deltaproteobacteria bacterium]
MNELVNRLIAEMPTFLFVLVRTGAVLMAAPVFGSVSAPLQLKMGLALVITLILVPFMGYVPMPATLPELAVSVTGEILVGAALGLVVRFVFTGVEFAGQIAGFQMGLGMANVFDPNTSAQVTVLGRLMSLFTLLVFLSINGHLMIIMALEKSFELIPPYGLALTTDFFEGVIHYSRDIFILGVKFAAPVMATLIFSNLALGILARTVPQLNMFVIGFSVTIMAGFFVLGLSLPYMEAKISGVFDELWHRLSYLMKVM